MDKARGRKPRNEARPFSRGAALWAFERRPIAQVRDVHGAAPSAARYARPVLTLGGRECVAAEQSAMRIFIERTAAPERPHPTGCWRVAGGIEWMPGHALAPCGGGARIVAPRAKVSMTRIADPQQRHTKPGGAWSTAQLLQAPRGWCVARLEALHQAARAHAPRARAGPGPSCAR